MLPPETTVQGWLFIQHENKNKKTKTRKQKQNKNNRIIYSRAVDLYFTVNIGYEVAPHRYNNNV